MKPEKTEKKNELKKAIGLRVRTARLELGLELEEIGEESLTDPSNVSRIEYGETKPSLDFLFSLTKVHNVNLNWLFTGEGPVFLKKKK